jgi:carbon monoxide dehydrogenase subunit G
MRFTLHAEADTTLIRDAWKLDMGVPGLLERLGARRIQSAAVENLSKLKELLEVGRVVLQDGRPATC